MRHVPVCKARSNKHAEMFAGHCSPHTPVCHVMGRAVTNNPGCPVVFVSFIVLIYFCEIMKRTGFSDICILCLETWVYSHHDSAAGLSARMHLTNRVTIWDLMIPSADGITGFTVRCTWNEKKIWLYQIYYLSRLQCKMYKHQIFFYRFSIKVQITSSIKNNKIEHVGDL